MMTSAATPELKSTRPLKILIVFFVESCSRLSVCGCIMSTLFSRAHLQFNEVLHQRKLALHKEFVSLEPGDCDGLRPVKNGRLPAWNAYSVHKYIHTRG